MNILIPIFASAVVVGVGIDVMILQHPSSYVVETPEALSAEYVAQSDNRDGFFHALPGGQTPDWVIGTDHVYRPPAPQFVPAAYMGTPLVLESLAPQPAIGNSVTNSVTVHLTPELSALSPNSTAALEDAPATDPAAVEGLPDA